MPATKESGTIVSLALLNTNLNRYQRDYLDCFVPFAAEALRALTAEVVSDLDLKQLLLEFFGLDFPQAAVHALLVRAKSDGLVTVDHGAYRPNRAKLDASRFLQ